MIETVTVPRRAAQRLVQFCQFPAELAADWAEIAAAVDHEIPWTRARTFLTDLRDLRHRHSLTATADQMSAYYTDRFADFEIDIRDARTLYELFVVLHIVGHAGHAAHGNGRITSEECAALNGVCKALATSIAVLVRDEVFTS